MTSVPADGEANLRAGRPIVKKNMSVPHTTAVLRMPTRDTGHTQWFIVPPVFHPSSQLPFSSHGRQERSEAFRSDGMDQQEADDKHHRAGYAMNRERSRPRPARPQND